MPTRILAIPLALLPPLALWAQPFQDPARPPQQDPLPAATDDDPPPVLPGLPGKHAAKIAEYFETCDHDGDGFVTLAEAERSLELDRDAFAQYDAALGPQGRDGRITADEFAARYLETIERQGAFKPPLTASGGVVPPLRTSEQLRVAYDASSNGFLSQEEVARALEDYQVESVSAKEAMEQLDADRNGRLDLGEIAALELMIEKAVKTLQWAPEFEGAESVLALFGAIQERPRVPGTAPGTPIIVGPVPVFHRLDLDRDASISMDDLLALQSPTRLEVRPSTVLADLDIDGDGALSEEEFRRALGDGPASTGMQ